MPVLYKISPALNLFYLAGFGHCTGKEIQDAGLRAAQEGADQAGMVRLVDLQGVTEMDITLEQLQALAQTSKQFEDAGIYQPRKAAIVARNEVDELIGKLYNMYLKQSLLDVHFFYTITEALQWLDRSDVLEDVLALKDKLARRYATGE